MTEMDEDSMDDDDISYILRHPSYEAVTAGGTRWQFTSGGPTGLGTVNGLIQRGREELVLCLTPEEAVEWAAALSALASYARNGYESGDSQ